MNLDPNDIALIEQYLDGDLSDEDAQLFEEKHASSPEFRDAVAFHRQLLGHLESQRKLALKSELREMMSHASAPSVINWKPFSIAASILLALGVIGVLRLQGPSSSQKLFDQYFDPYPVLSVVRGDTPNGLNPLHIYAEGKYEQFIETVKQGSTDVQYNVRTAQLRLALGNAYLALAEPEEAIEELNGVLKGQDYYPDAQWYLALAHLRLGAYDESKALLKGLIDQQTFYKSSARKLLASIEKTDN